MIKNKKIGALGLVLATSLYLVGCNNQESSDKNSGNETLSSLDSSFNDSTSDTLISLDSSLNTPTSDTLISLDSNLDGSTSEASSSSTSDNTSENNLTIDEVYSLFKTTYNNMLDFEKYSKGFTGRFNTDASFSMEIDNDNVDLGEVNSEGNAWSEGEKELFLEQINGIIATNGHSSGSQKEYVAYDLVNNVGYNGFYYQETNHFLKSANKMSHSTEAVIAKDGDNYYTFNKNEDCYYSDVETEYYKQLIGDDFYKEEFSYYISIINEFGDFIFESFEQFVDYLKDDFVDPNYFSKDDIEASLSFSLEDDVYSLSVKLNWKEETSSTSSQDDNFVREHIFSFVPNKYIDFELISTENTMDNMEICPDNDKSGVIPLINYYSLNTSLHASMEYEEEGCPTIEEDVTYQDEGNYRISINYYIGGKYLFNSYRCLEWGTEVTQLDLSGADQWFKEDMQWYKDPECTIPFNAETWPCYSLNLYTGLDSLNDDYALVGHYNFEDETNYQDCINNDDFNYYYDIFKVSGENGFVSYAYAYLNGKRIEKDDPITFVSGQINYIDFISLK